MSSAPFDALASELARLPGFGRRSAERAALSLACRGAVSINPLVEALIAVRDQLVPCEKCGALTTRDRNPCIYCTDQSRDSSRILVVETPGEILALERSGAFRGLYHCLNGHISPASGIGPRETTLDILEMRISSGQVKEVILALSTDVEGDATASYLKERLSALGVHVTRLAYGLPADSGVRYSDPLTLRRAISGRQDA